MDILYIDDDADDIESFLEALQRTEHAVKFSYALSANDALKKLNNYLAKPDVIFVDYRLGAIDGYECVRRIREREELKNIPVVVLSGNISPAIVDEFNKIGVYHFLSKTAILTDMQAALKVLLDGFSKTEKNRTGLDTVL
jgi:CheY-like chemotaxis protein